MTSWLRKILKLSVISLVLYYVFEIFQTNLVQASDYDFQVSKFDLSLSALSLLIFILIQSLLWHVILRLLGSHISLGRSVYCWFMSLPGKYLPGKLGYPLGRIYCHRQNGADGILITTCLYLEAVMILSASILVVAVSVPFYLEGISLGAIIPAIFLLLASLHPVFINRAMRFGLRFLGKKPVRIELKYTSLVGMVLLYSVTYFLFGGAYYFFILRSLTAFSINDFMFAVSIVSGGGLVGQLFFIFPAGLGIRDGFYAYITGIVLVDPIPAVAAIMARLIVTLVELTSAGAAFITGIFWQQNTDGSGKTDSP
jgi:hypothetical protein